MERRKVKARRDAREAKKRAARMRSVEELAEILGTGRNQTYEALARGDIKGAIRFGRRWLIPDAVIDRLVNGVTTTADTGITTTT